MTAPQTASKRTPYPERWASFGPADREKIAGSVERALELDQLLDSLGDMEPDAREELIGSWYRSVESIKARLEATEAHERRLREARRLLFARLLLAHESQAQVATKAGVSSMVVSYETGIATKQR